GVEPEVPLVALGGRGGAGEAVDGDLFDGAGIDVLDPARRQIFGKLLLGGHAHNVEPQRLAPAVFDPEHGLRGVVEVETFGRREGKAEPRMQEAAPAHEAFARVLAEYDAVDAGEVRVLVAATARGRGIELTRVGERIADPLRRCRMRREEIG